MAWDLGLVRGTSSGIARENAWKFRDHARGMNREASQLETLINQLRYNKEDAYRRERDNVRDTQWAKSHKLAVNADTRADERHDVLMEESEYRQSRRPIHEKRDKARFEWERQDALRRYETHERTKSRWDILDKQSDERHDLYMKSGQADYENMHGKEGVLPDALQSLVPRGFRRFLPEVMFDQPGYRDLQREQTQLSIDALKSDAEMRPLREQFERNKLIGDIEAQEWLQSDDGKKYTEKIRELGLTKLEEEIDYYKARSQALRNPQSTGGRTLKPPTVAEIESLGATLALPRALTSKEGRKLDFASLKGESQSELVRESGYSLGQRFREMMPISIMAQTELEERIAAAWRGMLGVSFKDGDDTRSVSSVLLNKVPAGQQDQHLSGVYQVFRKAAIEGMRSRSGTGGFDAAAKGMSLDGSARVGPPKDSWFVKDLAGQPTDVSKIDFSPPGWWSRFSEDLFHGVFGGVGTSSATKHGRNLFRINQWMNEQIREYSTSGNLDWDNFNKLSEDLKQKFYLKLPMDKRSEFKLRWHSYELELADPLKAR